MKGVRLTQSGNFVYFACWFLNPFITVISPMIDLEKTWKMKHYEPANQKFTEMAEEHRKLLWYTKL